MSRILFYVHVDVPGPFPLGRRLFCRGNGSAAGRRSGGDREPPFSRPRPRVRLAKLERRRAGQAGEDPGRFRAEDVTALAESMGLPPAATIPPEMKTRGYITLIRRNWHLLPYDQLLELLEMTPERLAFTLREDDFLWIKLGRLKPKCEPLRYHAAGRGGAAPRGRDSPRGRGGFRRGDPPPGGTAFRLRAAAQQPAALLLPAKAGRGSASSPCGSSIPIWPCTAIRC